MDISQIYSYLVLPGKNDPDAEEVAGTAIPLQGRMYEMLKKIFDQAEEECRIPIRFVMSEEGEQTNPVRDEVLLLIQNPVSDLGLALAERLQNVTTGRSGLGLLFITLGQNESGERKVVISRFPADQGVMAERDTTGLEVSFVERIFMKNATAYKAVVYRDSSFEKGFGTAQP